MLEHVAVQTFLFSWRSLRMILAVLVQFHDLEECAGELTQLSGLHGRGGQVVPSSRSQENYAVYMKGDGILVIKSCARFRYSLVFVALIPCRE